MMYNLIIAGVTGFLWVLFPPLSIMFITYIVLTQLDEIYNS
jgi:hypothetical protein